MAGLNETPNASRVRISFFGLRNAGKSTLVNAFTGQDVAIVSDMPGTTTDPVSKAMEILPLGPCLITDTAGLDDVGALGGERVKRTLAVLDATDIAVWVDGGEGKGSEWNSFSEACKRRGVVVVEYRRGEDVDALKKAIAAIKPAEVMPGLLEGMVAAGDCVVCVCPIDESAPKGRLILPQVQLIRECLDLHATALVCQPLELEACLSRQLGEVPRERVLVVTDSQAFAGVRKTLSECGQKIRLTSFSILFARQKGDLELYREGLETIGTLREGDEVLVAEGCTHHRQCNDIGTVKIPKALQRLAGCPLKFSFASGNEFDLARHPGVRLVVHCGGCMLTRRVVRGRLEACREAGVGVVNYGMLLAAAAGVDAPDENGIIYGT